MSEAERSQAASDVPLPGGDFSLFVTRLGVQALLSLGRIVNPVTGVAHKNLDQARMLREDLAMLFLKTEGNLDAREEEHLRKVLSDLEHQLEDAEDDGE